jgi:uncharacterized membrane protein
MLREHIYPGMTAWAAWGDTGWSAVRVMTVSKSKKNVKVERVDPKTEAPITRRAKAKISELVKRDSKLKGADKPEAPPAEVFAEQRKAEEVVAPPPAPTEPAVAPKKALTQEEKDARAEEISKLLHDYFGDKGSTDW